MTAAPLIVWFRNDLRLADNGALHAAHATGRPVQPLYILDDVLAGHWKLGAASRWWLHESLRALSERLDGLGATLLLARGSARDLVPDLARRLGASGVYCSRAYEPWAATLEAELKGTLAAEGVEFRRFAGTLLREPEEMQTGSGGPYKVYTPFWRSLSASALQPKLLEPPRRLTPPATKLKSETLESWGLRPSRPDWAGGLRKAWTPGEAQGLKALETFLQGPVASYAEDRNRPDREATSRLSAHLHFGEVSPARCWHLTQTHAAHDPKSDKGCETFLKELVWREFSHHLLFHWPSLPDSPWRSEFNRFAWKNDPKALRAWQRGLTGYPIVDAGMRELWQTGWMHNRVRMIVASFLIKDLMIPWQQGEAWFWDTLVDANLANNSASWQWVAGCGADAAPYFRIFNPVTQGETFDPDGAYIRRFVPELANLGRRYLHAPWLAPGEELQRANIALGRTYPRPIVDHAQARDAALAEIKSLKSSA